MRLLLDTHTLLWWLSDDDRLGRKAREVITDSGHDVLVSAVMLWEARIKQTIGKLELPEGFRDAIAEQGFREHALRGDYTDELARLPMLHRDPFDRMLVAQARTDALTLVSADRHIGSYDVALLDASQ